MIWKSAPAPLFSQPYSIDSCVEQLAHSLYHTLLPKTSHYDLILLCIGTDRCTGDALGPLVGSQLQHENIKLFQIYGTLDDPVHAVNLLNTMTKIKEKHHAPLILAIDACLGKYDHVGHVTLGVGPLKPGAAVRKKLPEVGDFHLTGTVNVGGFMEFMVLQNTRLSLVMKMAQTIGKALSLADQRLADTMLIKTGSPT